MTSPYVPALPASKGSGRSLSDNWRVFPYHDDSILNLRFIDQVMKKPVIDKIIRPADYPTCGEFEGNAEKLIFRMNDQGFNCYQTFNHLRQDFAGLSARDTDIEMVDKILIDVDRTKAVWTPTTKGTAEVSCPASQNELDESHRVAELIQNWLAVRGWPDPYLVQSGNGYHLYYLTDGDAIEAGSANSLLRKALLRALAQKFDNSHSQVDQGVYNNARITKIIGTLARKGQCSEGRPYRTVELISAPPIIDCVVNDDLRSVIDEICPELLTDPYRKPAESSGHIHLHQKQLGLFFAYGMPCRTSALTVSTIDGLSFFGRFFLRAGSARKKLPMNGRSVPHIVSMRRSSCISVTNLIQTI